MPSQDPPNEATVSLSPTEYFTFTPSVYFSPAPSASGTSPPTSIICIQNDSIPAYLKSVRPNITYIDQTKGGDASGGEIILLRGHKLGSNSSLLGVVINDVLSYKVCSFAVWKHSVSFNPLFDRENHVAPYVQCVTAATTVGWKNVTLFVDSLISLPYRNYRVTCKAGSYGDVGEYCASCLQSNSTAGKQGVASGMSCPNDNMKDPIAAPGILLTGDS